MSVSELSLSTMVCPNCAFNMWRGYANGVMHNVCVTCGWFVNRLIQTRKVSVIKGYYQLSKLNVIRESVGRQALTEKVFTELYRPQ